MANALTGDFDGVLEVSARTIERLLASVHQNAVTNPQSSHFPHVSYFRVDDSGLGIAGSVATQIGVPQVELIHESSDRVRLRVNVRARYRADPETNPLVDVIHGTVTAEYVFGGIDRNCYVAGDVADWISFRYVDGSASFDGVLANDAGFSISDVVNEANTQTNVEHLIDDVLRRRFAPSPQRVGKKLRRLRSLNYGAGPGEACIAFPMGLMNGEPQGDLASIQDSFLLGRDFGLAVSAPYLEAAVQPLLDGIVGLQRDLHIHGDAGLGGGLEVDYHVRLESADATWLGPLAVFGLSPGGVIRVHLSGKGWSTRVYRSGVYNVGSLSLSDLDMTFSVDQDVLLRFDSGGGSLLIGALGSPAVSVSYGGPFGGDVVPMARDTIGKQVGANLGAALANAANDFAELTAPSRTAPLVDALRRIDTFADARFEDAVFSPDGLVLVGRISLAPRHPAMASFEKTAAADGLDAIESWLPGGDVESFVWSWRWFTGGIASPPGKPGSVVVKDSFILNRQGAVSSRFGLTAFGESPLPGLDGMGQVCLVLQGTQVDSVTGERVPVSSRADCATFGLDLELPFEVGQYLRLFDGAVVNGEGRAPETGILRVGVPSSHESGSNTLVVYVAESLDDADETLRAGLDGCRRVGAGLLVLAILEEGAIAAGGEKLARQVDDLKAALKAPLAVTEDVSGGWAGTLGIDRVLPAWRLLTPKAITNWSHSGPLRPAELAEALDTRLLPSGPPIYSRIPPGISVGAYVDIGFPVADCPPLPLGRRGINGSAVTFLRNGEESSVRELERIRRQGSDSDGTIPVDAVIIEGADENEAATLQEQLRVPVFADRDGALTRRAGVRYLPTSLYVDSDGRLSSAVLGVSATGTYPAVGMGEGEAR